jgi:hypothetical protein
MIYCVWYPSGGFGHFINAILTLHGKEFKRPTNDITFSDVGDSHSLNLVAPKYSLGYRYKFESDYNYSVLVDQGINSTDSNFVYEFPGAQFIKVCYTDATWPAVAKTMINKAMRSTILSELPLNPDSWTSTDPWARREKYFLFLRDHKLRTAWRPEPDFDCIFIHDLLDYRQLKYTIEQIGIELTEFESLWNEWYVHNKKYFEPIALAKQVLDKIEHRESFDLSQITDIWTQAIIYYFIWTEFNKEVPHNDFENFFTDADQISEWLNQ